MLTIGFRFPGGRYHATPWDSHVNEGVIEWPPSPWRILRALLATRHLKAAGDVAEEAMRAVLSALSVELPMYRLPLGVTGFHTRHYMPVPPDKSVKVFDTFARIPNGSPILVHWNSVTLEGEARQALVTLLARVSYLGRAEAWTEASIEEQTDPSTMNCVANSEASDDRERIRLLAPLTANEFEAWRPAALDERLIRLLDKKRQASREKGKSADRVKLTAKEHAALEASLPRSIYEALHVDTQNLRIHGWNRPPGSRWVDYLRPRLDEPATVRTAYVSTATPPTVARYALAGPVLPRLTDAVFEAEKIHVALMSHSDGAPVFSGRDATTGQPLQGHQHALIIPEANGHHGLITHVTIIADMGFDGTAAAALGRLRKLWQRSQHDLQLVLLGMGRREDFAGTNLRAGQCPLLVESDAWVSRTPFVPTRHLKQRRNGQPIVDQHGLAIGSPEHDLVRLLVERGFPRPLKVDRIDHTILGGKPTRWLAFRTERRKGNGTRAQVHGVGLRLQFAEPVRGPVVAGYGAHFGLGCFVPDLQGTTFSRGSDGEHRPHR